MAIAVVALSLSLSAQCSAYWVPHAVAGTNGTVYASTPWDPDGSGPAPVLLVVAGYFTAAGTAAVSNIALYDPGTEIWSALGSGLD